MSKNFTKEELTILVHNSFDKSEKFFKQLIHQATEKSYKRASLIAYWISDYIDYQNNDDNFDPKSILNYSRGDIVQINFGYRVGRELGGRHYAVVIDIKNDYSSPLITVVPLHSLKKTFSQNRFNYLLKKGIYELIDEKFNIQFNSANNEYNKIQSKINRINSININNLSPKEANLLSAEVDLLSTKLNENQVLIDSANKTLTAMKKLKYGSVVEVGQIITISKQRICNPKMATDSLNGIRIDTTDLNQINNKIKQLYVYVK